mmetsp:Transcript_13937/g.20590  ORF Transcript_13937/g.20590 Transcript_13937/m.20590 type:complete len:97 (-) Transcript_13937:228-518(-)
MRVASVVLTLFLVSSTTQAFNIVPCRTQQSNISVITPLQMSSPLDGMNQEILNQKDDDDVPMTKAEMREEAKAMKAEMKRLKDEAAAAAKASKAEE